jgi:hypothetical protein
MELSVQHWLVITAFSLLLSAVFLGFIVWLLVDVRNEISRAADALEKLRDSPP